MLYLDSTGGFSAARVAELQQDLAARREAAKELCERVVPELGEETDSTAKTWAAREGGLAVDPPHMMVS